MACAPVLLAGEGSSPGLRRDSVEAGFPTPPGCSTRVHLPAYAGTPLKQEMNEHIAETSGSSPGLRRDSVEAWCGPSTPAGWSVHLPAYAGTPLKLKLTEAELGRLGAFISRPTPGRR